MTMNEEQVKIFEEVTKPVIEFLTNNCHPHTIIIIDNSSAELLEGIYCVQAQEK